MQNGEISALKGRNIPGCAPFFRRTCYALSGLRIFATLPRAALRSALGWYVRPLRGKSDGAFFRRALLALLVLPPKLVKAGHVKIDGAPVPEYQ